MGLIIFIIITIMISPGYAMHRSQEAGKSEFNLTLKHLGPSQVLMQVAPSITCSSSMTLAEHESSQVAMIDFNKTLLEQHTLFTRANELFNKHLVKNKTPDQALQSLKDHIKTLKEKYQHLKNSNSPKKTSEYKQLVKMHEELLVAQFTFNICIQQKMDKEYETSKRQAIGPSISSLLMQIEKDKKYSP